VVVALNLLSQSMSVGPTTATSSVPSQLARPCAAIDDWSVVAGHEGTASVTQLGSSCTWTLTGRTVQLLLLGKAASVHEALDDPGCVIIRRPRGHGCVVDHPLGGSSGGNGMVIVRHDGSIVTVSVTGLPVDQTRMMELAKIAAS